MSSVGEALVSHSVIVVVLGALAWALQASLRLEKVPILGIGEMTYSKSFRMFGFGLLMLPWVMAGVIGIAVSPKSAVEWRMLLEVGLCGSLVTVWFFLETQFRLGWVTSVGIEGQSFFSKRRSLMWEEVKHVRYSHLTYYLTFIGADGAKVRFHPYQTGFDYLYQQAIRHLPAGANRYALVEAWDARAAAGSGRA